MNFLAHFLLAGPDAPPDLILGNALPDLLPLAHPHARFRRHRVEAAAPCPLRDGVLLHLRADTAFHHAPAFDAAQRAFKHLLAQADFRAMRLRPFFLAHVGVELALDAALLRADLDLADTYYAALAAADFSSAQRWSEHVLGVELSMLPEVLADFLQSRYLTQYRSDAGVAEGLARVAVRAAQEAFEGEDFATLVEVMTQAIAAIADQAPSLLAETRAVL